MIPQQKIAEIRQRASIVEVISDFVTLRKTGRNHMGLCPFHAEKTPSFTVSEEKGIYHCFGCQSGGSVFHFLMNYDRLSFPEAVQRVAKRYGISLEYERGRSADQGGEREKLYRVNERVALNYQKLLRSHPEGRNASAYLKERGVDETAIERFMLGYAPRSGSNLLAVLRQENVSPADGCRLGLIAQRGERKYYEKFFGRVIFPILSPAGKVVAFGGRVLDHSLPKYLNSSETPLFHKGATLYGLYQAKDGIRQSDRVVIVEGYLDVIALAQHGVPYVAATLGTALTPDHVRVLSRYTKNIIALFDGDEAGHKAAARSFEIFLEAGLLGRAAFLPQGDDPDTFIRTRGTAALEQILEQATSLADYYFSWLEKRYGTTLEGKSQIAREVSRILAKVNNAFEADLLVRRAVDTLGIREELLRATKPAPAPRQAYAANQSANRNLNAQTGTRENIAEQSLVSLMLRLPAVIEQVCNHAEALKWFDPEWRNIVDGILSQWQEHGAIHIAELLEKVPSEAANQLTRLSMEREELTDAECARMAEDCLSHLRRRHLRTLERNLRLAIRAAEEQKDEKAKRERMLEWQDLVQKERQLDRQKHALKLPIR